MDELDKEIEETRARIRKTQQLNELKALQAQLTTPAAQPQAGQDPMFKMIKWAFPIGIVFVGLGLAAFMLFNNWTVGLTLDGLGAACIGVKVVLTPSIKIPIIDDMRKPKQSPGQTKG